MKMNSSNMFFLTCMIVGIMLCLSSNSWLFIWCGLELSLITFLPLMQSKLIISSESTLKYFLIQSISSATLILGLLMMMTSKLNCELIIFISMMMKMGVAPFHMWLLSVVEGLKALPLTLMLTLSKIPPIIILTMLNTSINLIVSLTLVTGGLLGLNQSSVKKIIAYSSIFNMGLILMVVKNNFIWFYYLTIYSILISVLISLINKFNMLYTNQMIMNEDFIINKMSLWLILLSMGGMPPFIGFTIKLIVIEYSINQLMIVNLFLIIMFSLLVMFFYLRMTYLSLMFFVQTPKWTLMKIQKFSSLMIVMNIMLTPMVLLMEMFK